MPTIVHASCSCRAYVTTSSTHRDLDLSQLVKQDVGRLEVIMYDTAGRPIEVRQAIKHLAGNSLGFLFWQDLGSNRGSA